VGDSNLQRILTAPLVPLLEGVLRSRHLARAPIHLYRRGFGFLFGSRMLMLEHVGRRTGAARHVVLEVIDHPAPGVYLLASGFGERAQWYRNVMANPNVTITTAGHREAPAKVRRLTRDEGDEALRRYRDEHPRAWANLKQIVERALDAPVDPPNSSLPIVEVRLT
jgi:deazaflavin-dependent oxidoreductase (nitroreductase family)